MIKGLDFLRHFSSAMAIKAWLGSSAVQAEPNSDIDVDTQLTAQQVDENASIGRIFNYERQPHFFWGKSDDYPAHGNDAKMMPWGRVYTRHAIDRMQPSDTRFSHSATLQFNAGRSIPPRYVELTLAYGQASTDDKGRKTYSLGDLDVGIMGDGAVNHIKYTRRKATERDNGIS